MWLYIPIVIALVAGVAMIATGIAPVGIPLLLIGIGGLVFHVRQGRPSREPRSVPGGFKETGYAHPGQEHMVPDQEPPAS